MSETAVAEALSELVDVAQTLLGPGGCPWDRSRDPEDVKSQLVEETYEVREAINRDEDGAIVEELGDLLYQIVFLTELYGDDREISLETVIKEITEKLVRRHPHVFEDEQAGTSEEGVSSWEKVKRSERQQNTSEETVVLSGVPDELPALLRAYRITQKAATAGFDWNHTSSAVSKVREELNELEQEIKRDNSDRSFEELGDLLFACANLGRKLDHDPEEALQQGNDQFKERFEAVERKIRNQGWEMEETTRSELLDLWEEARVEQTQDGS